jgi:mannose-6-phosphate isomerase-like protein (cupin superfamily)
MRLKVSGIVLGCTALGAITIQPSATLFENDQVKIVRALEKPHVKGKLHSHAQNRVMVYLQSGRQRFEYQDGRTPEVFDWTAGEVKWSPADGMHSPELVSDEPLNIIEVELKTSGTGKPITGDLDPVKVDPKHYRVELENSQVRVLRAKIGPHEATPMHEHSVNRVTVFLTDQELRVTDSNGATKLMTHHAGEAVWAAPAIHREENISDKPFEVIAIEVKN